jgi:hypothetical protein
VAGLGLLVFGIILMSLFFVPWLLMLALGALHSYFPEVPALGFWPCFFITFILGVIASIFRGRN